MTPPNPPPTDLAGGGSGTPVAPAAEPAAEPAAAPPGTPQLGDPQFRKAIAEGTARYPGLVYYPGYDLALALESVGKGWAGILTGAFAKLAELPRVRVVQVKEKFGSLRIYVEAGFTAEEQRILDALDADDETFEAEYEARLGSAVREAETQREAAEAIVDEAARASLTTCEECGDPGEARRSGWIRVRCAIHA